LLKKLTDEGQGMSTHLCITPRIIS
jgi:hypothetical protein